MNIVNGLGLEVGASGILPLSPCSGRFLIFMCSLPGQTFPHFITETGKQISTYHQGSAVHNDSESVLCFSFKVLNDSEKSVSRSVLLLSTYMMLERFGINLTNL